MSLEKKSIVIITGGSSGIGEALVNIFLQRDSFVIIVDKKENSSLQTVYHYGQNRCQFYKCNVEDELSVSELFISIMARYPRIDYLINAAGINTCNEDEDAQPSCKMTKYACIMMSKQKSQKVETPFKGVIVDLAQGSKQGINEISRNGLCPIYFQHGIRVINTPFKVFTDTIPIQQIKDIAYGIFKLAISHQDYSSFIELAPIGSPSL